MRFKNLAIAAAVLTITNLFLRSLEWRMAYLREIMDNCMFKLRVAENNLMERYSREATRVNLHTAFMNLYRDQDSNLDILIHDMSDTINLLDNWMHDDPYGAKAYSECINLLGDMRDYLCKIDLDPSLGFVPKTFKKGSWNKVDTSIESILDRDKDKNLQILFD